MRTTLAVISALASVASAQYVPFQLIMLNNSMETHGAACLDGSPVGFYYAPGQNEDAYNVMFYFEGGGWAYDLADAAGRSNTTLGSSKNWQTQGYLGGLFSSDCNKNPRFCRWSKVWLPYCDAMSFSGMREDPVYFNGLPLYFRGHNNILAIMDAITNPVTNPLPHPWSSTYDIVLSGCSAGGLATYLHADWFSETYVSANRPPPPGSTQTRNGRYYVIPISGYFLDAPNVEGKRVYTEQMKTIFYLANATNGVNADCVAAQKPGEEYLCAMAPHTYPFIKSRIFVTNSMYDSWQTGCILSAEPVWSPNDTMHNGNCSAVPGWWPCAKYPGNCTASQLQDFNNYRAEFIASLNLTGTASVAGNGGFLTSCHTHCEAQVDNDYVGFEIGGVSLKQAIYAWMDADPSAPAGENFYWDCEYNDNSSDWGCNPTCAVDPGFSSYFIDDNF